MGFGGVCVCRARYKRVWTVRGGRGWWRRRRRSRAGACGPWECGEAHGCAAACTSTSNTVMHARERRQQTCVQPASLGGRARAPLPRGGGAGGAKAKQAPLFMTHHVVPEPAGPAGQQAQWGAWQAHTGQSVRRQRPAAPASQAAVHGRAFAAAGADDDITRRATSSFRPRHPDPWAPPTHACAPQRSTTAEASAHYAVQLCTYVRCRTCCMCTLPALWPNSLCRTSATRGVCQPACTAAES